MRRRVCAGAVAVCLVAAGCSGDSDSEAVDPSPSAADTSSAAPTTEASTATAAETAASTAEASAALPEETAFTQTSDVVYMTLDGAEILMDVYEPAGDGPWPVVVSFHGLSPQGKDDIGTTGIAREAATRGMVVFTPTWIAGDPFPITVETVETWDDTVSCAVAFAQQNAVEFGGDAATTVVDGFSAGAGGALLFASLEPSADPIPGCETNALPTPVTGFVLGDGEYWLHSRNFDGAFEADLEAMQARLAAMIGPSSWLANPGAEFFLWVAGNGTNSRPIGDPSDESGWLAQRDPDGTIRA